LQILVQTGIFRNLASAEFFSNNVVRWRQSHYEIHPSNVRRHASVNSWRTRVGAPSSETGDSPKRVQTAVRRTYKRTTGIASASVDSLVLGIKGLD